MACSSREPAPGPIAAPPTSPSTSVNVMFRVAAAHAIACAFIVNPGVLLARSAGLAKSSQKRNSALANSCCGAKSSLDLNIPVYAHHLKWLLTLESCSINLTVYRSIKLARDIFAPNERRLCRVAYPALPSIIDVVDRRHRHARSRATRRHCCGQRGVPRVPRGRNR